MCTRSSRRHDGPLMTNEVIEYLEKIKTVRTGVDGRITFKIVIRTRSLPLRGSVFGLAFGP